MPIESKKTFLLHPIFTSSVETLFLYNRLLFVFLIVDIYRFKKVTLIFSMALVFNLNDTQQETEV